MKLEIIVNKTIELCTEVGSFIQKEAISFNRNNVELKGKNDLVSYVDKEAEKKLVEGLIKIIPESGFITEENTIKQSKATYTWIVDPLDGTTNFIHGMPLYAVSVGLLREDTLIGGVVYEINRGEAFYAWKGGGAYMNNKSIQVSKVKHISESLLATGFPFHNFENLDNYIAILNSLMKSSHGLRRLGSAATDLAYVACGRCEGFFEYNLNPWDIAAGIIIIEEAGGTVTDFSGGKNHLFGREIVAAGGVHAELLASIQRYW